MALILDTGVLYASLDRRDRDHQACADLLRDEDEMHIVPSPVLVELDYLVSERLGGGAMLAVLDAIMDASLVVEETTFEDIVRVRELTSTYADLRLGFVDAAVFAIVERFDANRLATLDRRHFTALRPRHRESIDLLPA